MKARYIHNTIDISYKGYHIKCDATGAWSIWKDGNLICPAEHDDDAKDWINHLLGEEE